MADAKRHVQGVLIVLMLRPPETGSVSRFPGGYSDILSGPFRQIVRPIPTDCSVNPDILIGFGAVNRNFQIF
jgi:hypothetical protein